MVMTTTDQGKKMQMSNDLKKEIERGIQLLELCQQLQSEKDGVDRPKPGVIDKTKVLDQFSQDVLSAMTNHSALFKLLPMMMELSELGRKLEADGAITVDFADDYSTAALAYFRTQYGLN